MCNKLSWESFLFFVKLLNECVNPFILPRGDKLSCLMYADDLIILSQTAVGLHNSLDILSKFCSAWGLTVNLSKTKTMVFQKKNKLANRFTFKYKDDLVKNVSHYTYLGNKTPGSGDFTKGTDILSIKAKNALAAGLKEKVINRKASTHYRKQALYVLLLANLYVYGSEVWRASLKDNFSYWDKHNIEKTHLHFCKTFLRVNKKGSNIGCRAEMGRFPIKIDIHTKILKY